MEYKFEFTEDLIISMNNRYRRQTTLGIILTFGKWILALPLIAMSLFCFYLKIWMNGFAFLAILALLPLSGYFDDYILRRRFRKSPFRDDVISLSVQGDGIHAVGKGSQSKFGWEVVTKVRAYKDGFLVFYGPNVFQWLGDAMLVSGTVEEVESTLRDRVKDFAVVEPRRI